MAERPYVRAPRPWWVIACTFVQTVVYATAVADFVAGFVFRPGGFGIPSEWWIPIGMFVAFAMNVPLEPGKWSGIPRYAGAPAWLYILVLMHVVLMLVAFVDLAATNSASIPFGPAVASCPLAVGLLGTWYGHWGTNRLG